MTSLVILFVLSVGMCASMPSSSIFAPYIEAAKTHRLQQKTRPLSPMVEHGVKMRFNLSEVDARKMMLGNGKPKGKEKGHEKRKDVPRQGHTYLPTVNLDKPSHPIPGMELKEEDKKDTHKESERVKSEGVGDKESTERKQVLDSEDMDGGMNLQKVDRIEAVGEDVKEMKKVELFDSVVMRVMLMMVCVYVAVGLVRMFGISEVGARRAAQRVRKSLCIKDMRV